MAEADTPGLVLGMDTTGMPLALAFRPQRLAIDAPGAALPELITILLERAFGLGAGVVAIVPRPVAEALRHSPWRDRLRLLDGDDPYGSAAIPWRTLAPDALDAALLAGNVLPSGSGGMATSFAALLAQTGAASYATDTVRSLTAPPGDDLRGVVAAGGGVVLVDDGDAGAPLLAALLLVLLAAQPPLRRPIVVIRPDHSTVPDALAAQALDVVLGTAITAHSTLAQTADGWTLTSADGTWQRALVADLRALAAAPDPTANAILRAGLAGDDAPTGPAPMAYAAPAPLEADAWSNADAPPAPVPAPIPADARVGGFAWDAMGQDLDTTLDDTPQAEDTEPVAMAMPVEDEAEPVDMPIVTAPVDMDMPTDETVQRDMTMPTVEALAPLDMTPLDMTPLDMDMPTLEAEPVDMDMPTDAAPTPLDMTALDMTTLDMDMPTLEAEPVDMDMTPLDMDMPTLEAESLDMAPLDMDMPTEDEAAPHLAALAPLDAWNVRLDDDDAAPAARTRRTSRRRIVWQPRPVAQPSYLIIINSHTQTKHPCFGLQPGNQLSLPAYRTAAIQ